MVLPLGGGYGTARSIGQEFIRKTASGHAQTLIARSPSANRSNTLCAIVRPMAPSESTPSAPSKYQGRMGAPTDRLESRRTSRIKRVREEELRQLSGRLLQLQDEERRRIARDLHDSASQKLLAISLSLAQLSKSADVRSNRGKQVLTDTRKMVRDLCKEIRSLSYLLHPPLLDELGLASAVEEYVKGFSKRSGIDLEFEMAVDIGRLSPESETALFRIVQEALGNIQKHSGSSTGKTRLTKEHGEIVLEISDSGRGMQAEHLQERQVGPRTLGVGILGMRERMRQLGGRLDISLEAGEPR